MKQTEILQTILDTLGIAARIEEQPAEQGVMLHVFTEETVVFHPANAGSLIEDLQFLVNRISQVHDENAPKAYVDVNRIREQRNNRLIDQVRSYAKLVRETGRPFHLEPMTAYDRRLVHNAFKDDPEIMTWSPSDDARIKRITLMRRPQKPAGAS